jgi:hypothetical protein
MDFERAFQYVFYGYRQRVICELLACSRQALYSWRKGYYKPCSKTRALWKLTGGAAAELAALLTAAETPIATAEEVRS